MDVLRYLAAAGLALALVVALWRWRTPRRLPFTRRGSLLTQAEMRFFRVLVHAVPGGLVVCPKVRLMDVLFVDDGAWKEFGAPASGMHVDFVLAEPGTLEPVLVIELDDRGHSGDAAKKRDQFKDAALAAAGVPILRVRAARGYNAGGLRAGIVGKTRQGKPDRMTP
jgi:Protein of unknown function (DUF2726)